MEPPEGLWVMRRSHGNPKTEVMFGRSLHAHGLLFCCIEQSIRMLVQATEIESSLGTFILKLCRATTPRTSDSSCGLRWISGLCEDQTITKV